MERADVDVANSSGTCLTKNQIFEITSSCRVELALRNLIPGNEVTIVTYRKEGKEKIAHPPITLEVR